MIHIDPNLKIEDLLVSIKDMWAASALKIKNIEKTYPEEKGAPVFTLQGKYTSRGWTEWTQGFQYGSSILQFEASGDEEFLAIGKSKTLHKMAPHLTHIGVHDHGFNNISTYGNLLRLMREGKIPQHDWEQHFYELALKVSGAVQASRWTSTATGGFIHSFNGPHSLFVDTIRSVRILYLSHFLGHKLKGENDKDLDLFLRAQQHIEATANFNVFYGNGRDAYDIKGRTAHECIFNTTDGAFRSSSTQQGYSGFSTWTRGLAWAMCGFAEELELLLQIGQKELAELCSKAAKATCDFYIHYAAADGIPYWDTGAPQLHLIEGWQNQDANPFNTFEPVDSSAAAIAAQGLLRLGKILDNPTYFSAGLQTAKALFSDRYTSKDPQHQGLLVHSVYHRPNDWDYRRPGSSISFGEACMWGDYHLRELATYIQSLHDRKPYRYYNCLNSLS